MLSRTKLVLVFVSTLLLGSLPAFGRAVELSQKEIAKLKNGELIKRPLLNSGKDSLIAGSSYMIINAPPDVVWRAFEDVSAWPSIYSHTYEAETIASKDNVVGVRLNIGMPFIREDVYLTVVKHPDSFDAVTTLNKSKSTPLAEDVRSSIRFLSQPDGRTLVVYSVATRTPFAPLVALLGNKVVRDMENVLLSLPRRLKRWVEGPQGAKYRI